MTEQLKAATIRAFYQALIAFGSIFFVTLQVTGFENPNRMEIAAIAGAVGFFSIMGTRGLGEGAIDSNRAANGRVTPADVGQ